MALTTVYLGYNSYVSLTNLGTIFCTSCSVSVQQQLITTSGSFLGKKLPGTDFWMNAPHRVDYANVQISVTFQILFDQISKLKTWINNRTKGKTVTINGVDIDDCFWTNIGLSVSQNQLLSCSITFTSFQNYSDFEIKLNSALGSQTAPASGMYKYNGSSVIPYYNTKINGFSYVSGWSLQLSQNLIKKSKLKNTSNNEGHLPVYCLFGVLSGTLKVNVFCNGSNAKLYNSKSSEIIQATANTISSSKTLKVVVKGSSEETVVTCSYVTLQSVTPNIAQESGIQTVEYSYLIHSLSTSSN